MNKALKDKWVAALRSGEYKQGQHFLAKYASEDRDDVAYCCLGVLARCVDAPVDALIEREMLSDFEEFDSFNKLVPLPLDVRQNIRSSFDLGSETLDTLVNMNDGSNPIGGAGVISNFNEIADWIEENV